MLNKTHELSKLRHGGTLAVFQWSLPIIYYSLMVYSLALWCIPSHSGILLIGFRPQGCGSLGQLSNIPVNVVQAMMCTPVAIVVLLPDALAVKRDLKWVSKVWQFSSPWLVLWCGCCGRSWLPRVPSLSLSQAHPRWSLRLFSGPRGLRCGCFGSGPWQSRCRPGGPQQRPGRCRGRADWPLWWGQTQTPTSLWSRSDTQRNTPSGPLQKNTYTEY